MLLQSWLRIVSCLLVWALVAAIHPMSSFANAVATFGFVHYLVSIRYAKNNIAKLMSAPREAFRLAIVLLCAIAWSQSSWNLLFLFGIHHVCNEVYLLHRNLGEIQYGQAKTLRAAALIFNFFIYLAILHDAPQVRHLDQVGLFVAVAMSGAFFAWQIWQMRRALTSPSLVDLCLLECIGLIFVAISFFVPVSLLHIVMYHFIFWGLNPIQAMIKQGGYRLLEYSLLNVVFTAVFFSLSPRSPFPFHATNPEFLAQFRLWSFIHILSSFGLSAAHPGWIRKWFQPPVMVLASKAR